MCIALCQSKHFESRGFYEAHDLLVYNVCCMHRVEWGKKVYILTLLALLPWWLFPTRKTSLERGSIIRNFLSLQVVARREPVLKENHVFSSYFGCWHWFTYWVTWSRLHLGDTQLHWQIGLWLYSRQESDDRIQHWTEYFPLLDAIRGV